MKSMLPSTSAPWVSLSDALLVAPDAVARANVIAGYMWAFTLVNMRTPELLDLFLSLHLDMLTSATNFGIDPVVNGICSCLQMRVETMPKDETLRGFVARSHGRRLAVVLPCLIVFEAASSLPVDVLPLSTSMEELFHYRRQFY